VVRELLGQLFWQLTIRVSKWGFALAMIFMLWGTAQNTDSPSSRTIPTYVCINGRACEQVIYEAPNPTPLLITRNER
jgi:hypothetical protein